MQHKNIIIGSDHAGYSLKERLKKYLIDSEYIVEDLGVFSEESADYPVIAKLVANKAATENKFAILVCGTGVGMCITANKIKGIRAVVCSDTSTARLSREHNNTNVLCLGARIIGEVLAKDICTIWLNSEFLGERHKKRLDMIENDE